VQYSPRLCAGASSETTLQNDPAGRSCQLAAGRNARCLKARGTCGERRREASLDRRAERAAARTYRLCPRSDCPSPITALVGSRPSLATRRQRRERAVARVRGNDSISRSSKRCSLSHARCKVAAWHTSHRTGSPSCSRRTRRKCYGWQCAWTAPPPVHARFGAAPVSAPRRARARKRRAMRRGRRENAAPTLDLPGHRPPGRRAWDVRAEGRRRACVGTAKRGWASGLPLLYVCKALSTGNESSGKR